MLNPKWTGTEIDRREMKTLGLEQVVKVKAIRLSIVGSDCPA
jgi:hypothetical protein